MHNLDLILTLTGGLGAALLFGYLTHRIGLSPIVGYLLAGVAVGPHTPGFIANQLMAEQLAEIGVILLMFGVGLHFHIEDLLKVRGVAIPGAVGQSIIAAILGMFTAHAFGGTWTAGLVFGLTLSVASTVVLVRVLTDARALHTRAGHIAVGWLVIEDLFTVVILVLLPALFKHAPGEGGGVIRFLFVLGLTGFKLATLVAAMSVFGARLIPRLLTHIAATRSRELFTLAVLALALGIAVGSALLFGVSMALGAFLAGMVVGRSDFSVRAASEALPMRDAFAVLFFVSVGMLFNPAAILANPGILIATLLIVLAAKPLSALCIMLLLRYPLRTSLSVAIALGQIGEFSFLLAVVARELGIFNESSTNTLVAASIVSITLNPLLYRMVDPASAWLGRQPWLGKLLPPASAEETSSTLSPSSVETSPHRAIVIGSGPIGQTVTRLLIENGITPAIIELNLETVERLRSDGMTVVYGDAAQRETLHAARVGDAESLILSADMLGATEVIRLARELNPALRILARSAYVRDLAPLRAAGADEVFSGEGEVAIAFTVEILEQLGATPEQIDRERERVHEVARGRDKTARNA